MGRKKTSGKNTSAAVIFLIVIVLAIIASILVNVLLVVKASKFGEGPTFSVFVSNEKENEILTFHRDKKSISVVKFEERVGDVYKYTEVPVNAFYHSDGLDTSSSVSEMTSDILFGLPTSKSNLNTFDSLQMMLMAKTVSPKDIREKQIPRKLIESQRDEELGSLFSDGKIKEENLTIQVVNSTQEQGAGGRIARIISNIGGDVVLVSGSDENKKSGIYGGKDYYTVKRLSQVLNFPNVEGKMGGIADVVVVIGEDYAELSKY